MAAMPIRIVLRIRRTNDRLVAWVGGSLAVHAAVALGLLALPMFASAAKRPIDAATIVTLAAAPPPSQVAPAAAIAPATPPAPAPTTPPPKGPSAVPNIPKPQPKPTPKPEPERPRHPEPPPTKAPSAPAEDPKKTPAPGSSASAAPNRGGAATGAAITALEDGDPSLAWYHENIRGLLDTNWVRPVLEQEKQTFSVTVAFEIARDGSLRNLRVETSSGVPVVDLSALRAVRDSAPFPPPPPARAEDLVRSRVRFDYVPGEQR